MYATAYAANEVHGGIAVTNPLCRDDCWTEATTHIQALAEAIDASVYLVYVSFLHCTYQMA